MLFFKNAWKSWDIHHRHNSTCTTKWSTKCWISFICLWTSSFYQFKTISTYVCVYFCLSKKYCTRQVKCICTTFEIYHKLQNWYQSFMFCLKINNIVLPKHIYCTKHTFDKMFLIKSPNHFFLNFTIGSHKLDILQIQMHIYDKIIQNQIFLW